MRTFLAAALLLGLIPPAAAEDGGKVFRAGAAVSDVSPTELPAVVNGGFLEARAAKLRDPLFARALVLDDGVTRLAVVVVDSCMVPRDLLDRAKAIVRARTGLPAGRVLISATHTHSAPAATGALGCAPDVRYAATLPERIAEAVVRAVGRLAPAQVGWASVVDDEHTHCRRWVRRPDRLLSDPFGVVNVRANMHPGYQSPDVIGPAGAVDPGLSVLAVRAPGGRPVALLANYSMHYFGTEPVSADYFGRFSRAIGPMIGAGGGTGDPPFVGIMSQGTSGDLHWMDYARPQSAETIDGYAEGVARSAARAYRKIEFRDRVTLAMAETTLRLKRRVPSEARLARARAVVQAMGDRAPRDLPEVYAREAVYLHDDPERDLILQALRIGDLGVVAIPNEVFGLTGLKIKARSPLASTFTVELANGGEGYIPPPEQHALGGYTTWPARTAALVPEAEPAIVEAVLTLLETVSGRPRRTEAPAASPYAEAVLAAKPFAYWRLDEMDGSTARDATGAGRVGWLRSGYALFLEGAEPHGRAVHLAGGRVTADATRLKAPDSVALWFWNGLPADARGVTGVLLDRGGAAGRVGVGGTGYARGRLFLSNGGDPGSFPAGRAEILPKTWHHLAVVREKNRVRVFLDGTEEVSGDVVGGEDAVSIGGGDDAGTRFEGKVDEVALFDRALSAGEVRRLYESRPRDAGGQR